MKRSCPKCREEVEITHFDPLEEVQCCACQHWFSVAAEFAEPDSAVDRPEETMAAVPAPAMSQLVDSFRAGLLRDEPRRPLSDWLSEVEEPDRPLLLQLLLQTDSQVRIGRGERPDKASSLRDLPGYETIVEEFWNQDTANLDPSGTVSYQDRETRAVQHTSGPTSSPRPQADSGSVPPGYEYIRDLGEGGFGVVVLARDLTLGRLVALKFLKDDGSRQAQRFEAEARVLAQFKNPNVLQIHDFGRWNNSLYLALEYVEGGTLADRLDGTPLDERQAARLVETLSRAVGEVHQYDVVHRDLKPANILIAEDEETPLADCTMKIADFGLAKASVSDNEMTQAGVVMGTPSYMAPEQARGDAIDATPETDVYSLGVILYELLTGRRPFAAATPVEACHQVIHDEPVRPKQLAPKLSIDLDTICLKCLEKAPQKRYLNAFELAEDLRRFNHGLAIKARKTTAVERLVRLCRRHRLASSLIATLLIGLVGGLILFATLWQKSERRRDRLRKLVYTSEASEHVRAMQVGDMESVIDWVDNPTVNAGDIRGFEWGVLNTARREYRSILEYNEDRSDAAAYSPDGDTLVVVGADSGILVVRTSDSKVLGRHLAENEDGYPAQYFDATFFPDGKTLAVTARQTESSNGRLGQRTTVRLIDTETWEEQRRWVSRASQLALSSDAKFLAAASRKLHIWNVESEEDIVPQWPAATREQLAVSSRAEFAPTGHRLAVTGTSQDGQHVTLIVDVPSGEVLQQFQHDGLASRARWSPDGRTLAVGMYAEGTVHTYDVATGQKLSEFIAQPNLHEVRFSRDGKLLYAANFEGEARVWRLVDRVLLRVIKQVTGNFDFSPDGKTMAVASRDGAIQILNVDNNADHFAITHDAPERAYDSASLMWDVAPGSRTLVVVRDKKLQFVDLDRAKTTRTVDIEEQVTKVRASADAQVVAFQTTGDRVVVWDAQRGRSPAIEKTQLLKVSADGSKLLLTPVAKGPGIGVWDLQTGKYLMDRAFDGKVHGVDASHDGTRIAFIMRDGTLHRWKLDPPEDLPPLKLKRKASFVRDREFAVSHDGRWVCATTGHRHLDIREFETGKEVLALKENVQVWSVDLSKDHRTLAIGTRRGAVSLWNIPTGRRVGILESDAESVRSVDFTTDGSALIITGSQGHARIWRANANLNPAAN